MKSTMTQQPDPTTMSSWKFRIALIVTCMAFVMGLLLVESGPMIGGGLSSYQGGSAAGTVNKISSPSERRLYYNNIVLMGQFNYNNIHLEYVAHWYKRWSGLFEHVQVRGPFTEEQIQTLHEKYNVSSVYNAPDDKGFYSPVLNLVETLKQYLHDSNIKGIISIHDDLQLNFTYVHKIISRASIDNSKTIFTQVDNTSKYKQTNKIVILRLSKSSLM